MPGSEPLAHLSHETLLRFCDGSLAPAEAQRAQQHLQSCWHCRHASEELAATLHAFVSYCDHGFAAITAEGTPPGAARMMLGARLAQQAREPGMQGAAGSFFAALRRSLQPLLRPQISTSLMAVVLAIYWLLIPGAGQRAAASELLSRSQTAERALLQQQGGAPLFHQKLEVLSGARRAQWELWRFPSRGLFHQTWSGDPHLSGELAELYAAQNWDIKRPLSAANFVTWRASVPPKSEQVAQGEQGSSVIHVRANEGRLTSASITLRAKDLHPVSQTLLWGSPPETARSYEIREVSFEVAAFEHIPAGIFAPHAPLMSAKPPSALPAVPESKSSPTRMELEESEARLREALHLSGLQSRLAPRIKTDASGVILQAIVENQQQKEQLVALARDNRYVQVQIWEPEDSEGAEPAAVAASVAPRLRTAPPMESNLREYFGSTELANGFLNQVESRLRASLASALALQQLAERYPAAHIMALSPAAAASVRHIGTDHLETLKTNWQQADALLAPVLSQLGPAAVPPADAVCVGWGNLQETVRRLRRLESSVQLLFVPREGRLVAPPDTAQLLDDTGAARAYLSQCIPALQVP